VSKKTPKYKFNNTQDLDFELTSISAIYKKSELKLSIPHRQEFYGLFYFTNSFGKYFVDFKEYEIKKGSIFFISNEQIHFFRNIEKTTGNVILFTNTFLENDFLIEQVFEQNIGNPSVPIDSELLKEIDLLISQIKYILNSSKKMKLDILKKYLEIILLEIFQSKQEDLPLQNIYYQRFIQFKKDLKVHFKKHKNVKFYADKQFITTKTLNLAVREVVDKSAKQFIGEYLILLAKRMLINSKYSISEITYSLGFDEPTNFIKFFKNKEIITPSIFQKKYM